MLQDPVKGVLVPLTPEDAQALADLGLRFDPAARIADGAWVGLDDVVARADQAELAIGPILAGLQPLPALSPASYESAYSAMISGDHAAAAAGFAAVAVGAGPAAPALYGLALALEELGSHEAAEALAGFVSDLPGYGDPRAAALAGYAAFQRRQSKAARVYLAKAARIARLQPEFRGVQRFAQRVLLMQQFALGD